MSLLMIYPVFSKKGRKFYERGMKKIFFYERGNEFTHDLPCIFKKRPKILRAWNGKKIFFYERGNEFTHDLPCIFKKRPKILRAWNEKFQKINFFKKIKILRKFYLVNLE